MIRVIIADDEEKICQLIYNLADWDAMDMHVVGMAQNGIEALKMVKTLTPDLMITDIRMPGIDGLEMVHRAKDLNENLAFIIISGYQHFKYAQKAIQYGVSDYLLKPIQKDDLMAALNRVRTLYCQKNEQANKEKTLQEQLKNSEDSLHDRLFSKIMLGKDIGNLTLESVNSSYCFSFQPGSFLIFGVKIDCDDQKEHDNAIKMLKEKTAQEICHVFRAVSYDLAIHHGDSIVWCLINYSLDAEIEIRKNMKSILDDLLMQTSPFDDISFTVGVGMAVKDVRSLSGSFLAAKRAVFQRLLAGTGQLIQGATVPVENLEGMDPILAELNEGLAPAVELLDKKGVLDCLQRFRFSILKEKKLNGEEIFYIVSQAYLMYLMHLRNGHISIGNVENLKKQFQSYAGCCGSADRLFQYFLKTVSDSMDQVLEEKKQMDTKPIRQAKQYIRQHFQSPLTLEKVSSMVGFSPSYFSTLFKKETGCNFVDFLTNVRIDESKRLLRETNDSVFSICGQVGYLDLKSFTKNFKKYTGLKPNEYRKLYS